MFKSWFNQVVFDYVIKPVTPLLIKSGESGENTIDPGLPDMMFVRTFSSTYQGETVYFPGSSLKGVFRSHAERILRSLDKRVCNILDRNSPCRSRNLGNKTGTERYAQSCSVCKIFGSTNLAGRIIFTDAFPESSESVKTEIRTCVAIDRVLSSAARSGPFEMEVLTQGTFKGKITLKNFELWQVNLLFHIISDINNALVQFGYGKTKGFGIVSFSVEKAAWFQLKDTGHLNGIGYFHESPQKAGLRSGDQINIPQGLTSESTFSGVLYQFKTQTTIDQLKTLLKPMTF